METFVWKGAEKGGLWLCCLPGKGRWILNWNRHWGPKQRAESAGWHLTAVGLTVVQILSVLFASLVVPWWSLTYLLTIEVCTGKRKTARSPASLLSQLWHCQGQTLLCAGHSFPGLFSYHPSSWLLSPTPLHLLSPLFRTRLLYNDYKTLLPTLTSV
jgi:hypothetical protein